MRLTTDAPIDLADGDETEIQILKWGSFEHARHGKFSVTPEHGEQMVRNYDAERARGHERFVTIGHPAKLDGEPASGWIRGLRLAADGVFAKLALLPDTARRIKAGEFRYFSPTFTTAGRDEFGKPIGVQLLSGAITNDPFLKGMRPFELAASAADEDMTMSDTTTSTTLTADEAEALTTKLSASEAQVVALAAQVDELTKAAADKDAAMKKLSDERDALALAAVQQDARTEIRAAIGSGRLAPADIDHGWEADPIKALSDAGFAGIEGFRAQMKRRAANSRVDLSANTSADAANATSAPADQAHLDDLKAIAEKTGIKLEFLKKAASNDAERQV